MTVEKEFTVTYKWPDIWYTERSCKEFIVNGAGLPDVTVNAGDPQLSIVVPPYEVPAECGLDISISYNQSDEVARLIDISSTASNLSRTLSLLVPPTAKATLIEVHILLTYTATAYNVHST